MSLLVSLSRCPRKAGTALTRVRNRLLFGIYGISYGKGCRFEGRIWLSVDDGAKVKIGDGCHITGGRFTNRIARDLASSISAASGASISIGSGCGISSSCIWAHKDIRIGRNVNIGADCIIMDHDAHSLNHVQRHCYKDDQSGTASAPISIGDDAFVGARTIVLKGVSIGERSVVGAGSVVTCDIPSDEIWAGNPARFIRRL